MFKKISLLTVAAFVTAAYADIALDLHVVLTQGESVRKINKQIIVAENSSVELYRCEGGQLIGCVDNVSENGATLHLQVNACAGEVCTTISNPTIALEWDKKDRLTVAHENDTLIVEVTATQVQTAN
ncbi:hypothetical protein EKK58_01720 [Candidatus Dependentiae bacterium]|nr:MAG: hypothetical protein EKK58_01720 [Candidatus Dependentiae bacterium]